MSETISVNQVMASIAPGTRMGPYQVVSFIAAGGMGEVYRGHDARLGRHVAIKVLRAEAFSSADAVRRFEREARAAAAVVHPNLVSIHDVGCERGVHYLVMDLLEGQNLRQRLASGAMQWPEALQLAGAIVDGVGAMHAKSLIHRDLKPENVFITREGWVKLLDFGLVLPHVAAAEPSPRDRTAEALTARGIIVGTMGYMAPEQLCGHAVDGRTDIFAIGCILYEMLSGERLFSGFTQAETIAAILNPTPIALPATVPPDFKDVVRRCLERRPERRYQSIAELASALRAVGKAGTPVTLPDPSPSIAVLPFSNIGADKENEYFCEGLSEEILNALSRVPGLKVTARTSAFAFRGKHEDVRRIGEALGVKTILEGSVRRDGNRVRVTAQLVDAASGYHLWSDRFDRAMTDALAVQDEISSAIAETLHVRLAGRKSGQLHAPDVGAYHAYLKSRYHFAKLTPDRLRLSQALAEEAIALDADYPAPHAQLAECFMQSAVYGGPAKVLIPRAREAALKAVALDESEPSAQMTLARIAGEFDFDWTEALRRCRLALGTARISPAVRALCAQYILWPLGRVDELTAAIQPAFAADPLSPMPRFVMAQVLVARGEYDQALRDIADLLEIHESFWPAYSSRSAIFTAMGRTPEAIADLEKGLAVSPWNPIFSGLLSGHYLRAGDPARAQEMLEQFVQYAPSVLGALARSLFHYVSLDFDRAAGEYETVVDARYPVAAYYFTWMCLYEPFRESAPGRRIREKMGL